MIWRTIVVAAVCWVVGATGQALAQADPAVEAFERRIAGRAARVVERLALDDAARADQVQRVLVDHMRQLSAIQDARDAALERAELPRAEVDAIRGRAMRETLAAHGAFVARLTALLDDGQVEQIKDALTFDMVPLSFATYQEMFPAMTEREKAQVYAWFVESREQAMMAGSAEEKLDVFRENKHRMHAYLAEGGHDVDAALKAQEARRAARATTRPAE